MAARFGDQAFDQLKFDELLVNFFVATDQPFQLTENPHFRDLLHYLQYTYPTMKPEHKTMPAKGTSWNSDDEGGASDQDINHVDTGAKSMKVPMRKRKKLQEKVMKKGEATVQELKQELMRTRLSTLLSMHGRLKMASPFSAPPLLTSTRTGRLLKLSLISQSFKDHTRGRIWQRQCGGVSRTLASLIRSAVSLQIMHLIMIA
ncbi:hypothetical protein BT69DRAFT_161341 [Atractiella rhizophila]|nr:hypothetical protein BT69DRAFT_161341 [Atractiella rhizophila]